MRKNLYFHVRTRANLRSAWRKVRTSGLQSNSVDTVRAIREFDKDSEKYIEQIYRRLLKNDFRFKAVHGVALRRIGKRTPRPIVVAEIPDKIVKRAALQIVLRQDEVKKLVEFKYSYGGVQDRGVPDAIREVRSAIGDGAAYFLKSDIIDFYRNIPRHQALDLLFQSLPDQTLNKMLSSASTVELDNLGDMQHLYPGLFPSYELGVGQGCSLSPLLGNILLHDFDMAANSHGCICTRYIDDFLILGPTNKAVWSAFKKGLSVLDKLKLDVYRPTAHPDKASEGPTSRAFDYLGCQVCPNFVQPSAEARRKIIAEVEAVLHTSISKLRTGFRAHEYSLVTTLYYINHKVHAWACHYSFCDGRQSMHHLDEQIDTLLREYIRSYDAMRHDATAAEQRRLLGVQLLKDTKYST